MKPLPDLPNLLYESTSANGKDNQENRNDSRHIPQPSFSRHHANAPVFVPKHNQEYKNREQLEILQGQEKELFNEKLIAEHRAHAFTPHYRDIKSSGKAYNLAMNPHALFDNYTHYKALRFMAKTHVWNRRPTPNIALPNAPQGVPAVQQFVKMDGDHAIYRVIAEKEDKYILLACYMNTHGLHRGDLRFVEVNNRTRTNASEYNCMGFLALGDLLAVSELSRIAEWSSELGFVDVQKMTQETPCVWMVTRMTLLMRQTFQDIPFAFLTNGTAVALKWKQPLIVKNNNLYAEREKFIFISSGFIADKVPEFASGTIDPENKALLGLTREITQYPWATGTILQYAFHPGWTLQIQIGHDAYRPMPNVWNPDPDGCVEFCAMMGASATAAVLAGHFDCRAFKMIEPSISGDLIVFKIDNTLEPKPEHVWKANTRISIGSSKRDANAVIEVVSVIGPHLLITARISREFPFELEDEIHMVLQREMSEGKGLEDGFLEKLRTGTNGETILFPLFGGRPLIQETMYYSVNYSFPGNFPIELNADQNMYVNSLLRNVPITVANSPFGCGKSMTIATAAYYAVLRSRTVGHGSQQLLVTQSNFASVNLVDITKKYADLCRVVRYVSLSDWQELADESRSDLDLPVVMLNEFSKFVTGEKEGATTEELFQMAMYLKEFNHIEIDEMVPKIQGFFRNNTEFAKPKFYRLTMMFFKLTNPELIITTADSLQSVLSALSKQIDTVQFDEASQMPESALIQVIARFPNAYYGLVGDIRQLGPFMDYLLSANLAKYGIGETLKRAIENRMFPQYNLRNVYRCHPFTTNLLGELFYGGSLTTNVRAPDRDEFMRSNPGFWPNSNCPIMVIHNGVPGERQQTSMSNETEVMIVNNVIEEIIYHPNSPIKPSDIGVITYYKAQQARMSEYFREKDVKVGTVDSFQGMEREVMIVGCTNEIMTSFLCNPNRINVSMSRAKQATIIVGNVNSLRTTIYWERFVREAERYGCVRYSS